MNPRDTVRTALESVGSHRLRSLLTVLGIFVGIAAVILTVGLGAGARADVQEQIDALGTNVLVVSPGSSTDDSGTRGGLGTASTLTTRDAQALSDPDAAPDVAAVAAAGETSAALTAGDENWTTTLVGTTASWAQVRSRGLESGKFVDAEDVADAAMVVVLGSDTATELFGTTSAVGQEVVTSGRVLEVIGVLEAVSSSDDAGADDVAIVPSTTYAQRLVGGTDRESVSQIYVKADSEDDLSAAYTETVTLLANLHGVTDLDDADFSVATQESVLAASATVDSTLTVMLGGIAGISLLVGGIGVMNIMLVSVSERVREIGLRKALGAPPRAIRRQFLVEAGMLGLAGGIAGAGLSLVGALLLPQVTDARVELSALVCAGAVAGAVGIGLVFGVYPAARAARLAPIDALRSE